MTDTQIILLCVGLLVLVYTIALIVSIALCKAAGLKAPHSYEHSCNGGYTDEEMKEITKEDK